MKVPIRLTILRFAPGFAANYPERGGGVLIVIRAGNYVEFPVPTLTFMKNMTW